ncbi:DUF895 domain membrane protein [Moelleriella libera RCEF 2490]|uniref:DUF895 domain membrane protein n=1 Tax=Moelleriella libera RCEF 2490 TaxID=1081109 RepID=A0A167YT65_9HYPO|nr:DUF895 domain membrane protein [Moelleriella libera RCEF 2490]
MTVLGLCNFVAPGLWGAMNSLGAGGAQKPYLVNTANALTFCLMVVSCWFSSALVHLIGIKGALVFGTLGFAPYTAGLYTNNRFGTEWLVILGAALCGISAGVFWMAEAAIAITYPEPWNQGRALGYWLTFSRLGQILGGAVNLGLNAGNDRPGKVSYTVYLVIVALQAAGPLVALLLSQPHQVQRRDGQKVSLAILGKPWVEISRTTRLFFSRDFLLVVRFIGQAVFAEAVFFTYLSLWFSVRARALASFLSGIIALVGGNVLGVIVILQGGWWTWATVLVTKFKHTQPSYDWSSSGFPAAFLVFIFLTLGFHLNYLFLFFIIHNLADNNDEVIRYSALLRGTESAWQAVSYGISSIAIIAQVGGIYANFALWALSIGPAWLVVRQFGSRGEERRLEVASADGGNNPAEVSPKH